MMLDVTSSGPMPVLEATLRFAGARQRLLAHNVANISTPDFRPMDVDPGAFQEMLGEAIEDRRRRTGGQRGELRLGGSREVRVGPKGELTLDPRRPTGNVLFHDRNNRDVERVMQDLAENAATYRVAVDLMTNHTRQIHSALAERVG